MSNIFKDAAGKPFVVTDSGNKIALSTQETQRSHTELKRYPTTPTKSKFKLVTVRRLSDYTVDELNQQLNASYKQLEATALATGQPSPYPIRPINEADVSNVYGVFIDEDLYGRSTPVYVFFSNVSKAKCYIVATGQSRNDWTVHIAHLLEKANNTDGTNTTHWRIVTIDSSDTGRLFYTLEDSGLPDCYSYNFDIESLHYIGGGTWTGMAIDPDDRIPIYYSTRANDNRYIPVGVIFKNMGESRVRSIVAYSVTPTYVFTWQRGKLELTRRQREANQVANVPLLRNDGVYEITRSHSYSLDTVQRLANTENNNNISKVTQSEYSNGSATYVANTNAPEMASMLQTPDFGTDKKRMSVRSVRMHTNVIRPIQPITSNVSVLNKISLCPLSYAPVVCASPDMSVYIRYNLGEASGQIDHPYEVKLTTGKRGFQYGEAYKLWWTYGRVLETYAIGDTNRYRRLKSPGFKPDGTRMPDKVKIGSMFDLGELRIHPENPNAIETTWESRQFPQTGYFGFEEGNLTFAIQYLNPPLLGHQGVYYYHINPPIIGTSTSLTEYDDERYSFAEERDKRNTLRNYYVQILGGLAGASLDNLDIGNILIAPNDIESIVVREPNNSQYNALLDEPETFPAGYFESPFYGFTLTNENEGTMFGYDMQGNINSSYRFI